MNANGYATIRNNGKNYGPQEWLDGACPFTGCGTDYSMTDPLAKFLIDPRSYGHGWQSVTLNDLIEDCLNAWVSAYVKDIEYWYSEECIREDITANDIEFEADGSIH